MIYKIKSNDERIMNWNATGEERIVQNVLNIIRTRKYEIPFNRQMGINPDYIDDSIENNRADIINDVYNNIEKYESNVEILKVEIESSDTNGDIIIAVEIEV